MNAVVACLFSNLLMNELGLGIFLSCLLCQLVVFLCIRKTLPSPFPFCRILELFHLCTHSNSVTLFLSVLAPWCRIHFSFFHFIHVSLFVFCFSFAVVGCLCLFHFWGFDSISIACAIMSIAYSNDACQSGNFCLGPLTPILALLSFGKVGGDLNLFYTLEKGHSPSNSFCNLHSGPVVRAGF